jgi:transposase-like protein
MFERDRTRPYVIRYALYLYFLLGLSLRSSTSKALEPFVDRSYVAIIWYWIQQQFNPKHLYPNKRKSRITAFVIDETEIQIGSDEAWLWVAAVEPVHKQILGVYISRHRNMLIAEVFLQSLIKLYGKRLSIVMVEHGISSVYFLSRTKT